MLNKLVRRQLDKAFGKSFEPTPEMLDFINAVSNSYDHFEKDRIIIERTMELNSVELTNANKKLRAESEENNIVLSKLKESLSLLIAEQNPLQKVNEFKILDVANLLTEEIEKRKIAERKLNEHLKDLERTNRELDQFAYVVSHDLKAPLRAISSLAEWIQEELEESLSPDTRKNFELLRGRTARMENMIQGILAYTKAGKLRGEIIEVDTNELIHDIIDSLNPPSGINIIIETSMPVIYTESIKLQQVFSNLISNAIKYLGKKVGHIKIGCLLLEGYCQFYVEDDGPGIEKEYHDKIFMIFQTLSARDHVESTGIGLSIVKKIVDDMNGKIWVESEPNHGSKFSFTWKTDQIKKKKQIA